MGALSNQSISNRHSIRIEASVIPAKGKKIRIELALDLESLTYVDDEKKADTLSITVDNFTGAYWDNAIFRKGNLITISWGYPGMMAPQRTCKIENAKGGQILTIEAKATSVLLHKNRRCVTYEDKTRSEVITAIAKLHGYEGAAAHIEPTTDRIDVIVQASMTDAKFCKRLAAKEGFEFFIDWDGFHWHPRRFNAQPTRRFVWYGVGINAAENSIISYSVENDLTAKPGRVKAKGHDPKSKKAIEGTGSNADTDRPVLTEVIEVRDSVNHKWIKHTVAIEGNEETIPSTEDTASKIQGRANARFRKIQQTAVELTLNVIGDPLILAKTVIEVAGISTRLDGKYYIISVTHSMGSGYSCTLRCITDGSKGYKGKGLSTNAALAGENSSGRRVPDSVTGIMRDVASQLRAEVKAKRIVGRSPSGSQLANRIDDLIKQIHSDPTNFALLQQVEELGDEIGRLGHESKNKRIERAGKATQTVATKATAQAEEAKTQGKLNTKQIESAGEKPLLERKLIEDPVAKESREIFQIRRS